jgi:hypothetical protein
LPAHVRCQLAAVLELMQRELRHYRSGPPQRVQHLDRLRGRNCRREARRMLGETKGRAVI